MCKRGLNKKLAKYTGYLGTPKQNAQLDAEVLAEKNKKLAEWEVMNEQELNRKLAEWAGLKWRWNHNPDCNCGAIDDDDSMRSWHSLDGELATRFYHEDINFTQSLNACFEWLVPKLVEAELKYNCRVSPKHSDQFLAHVADDRHSATKEAETPALALCLSIVELIDN